jgi:hypothetical protein
MIKEGRKGVIDGEERNENEKRKYWHINDDSGRNGVIDGEKRNGNEERRGKERKTRKRGRVQSKPRLEEYVNI